MGLLDSISSYFRVFKTNHISWYNNKEKTVRCLLTPFIELTIGSKALIIQ